MEEMEEKEVTNRLSEAYEILHQAGRRVLEEQGISPDTETAREALDWSAEALHRIGLLPSLVCPPDPFFKEVQED